MNDASRMRDIPAIARVFRHSPLAGMGGGSALTCTVLGVFEHPSQAFGIPVHTFFQHM